MLVRYQQQLRNIGLLRRVMLGALVTLITLLALLAPLHHQAVAGPPRPRLALL